MRLIPGYEVNNDKVTKVLDSMLDWIRSKFDAISYLVFWLILGVAVTLTAFQIHATLISVAVVVVDNPSLRPIGWTTFSIYGLSPLLWLILGIGWLGWIMVTMNIYVKVSNLRS